MGDRIVVAYDFSDSADRALAWARELARVRGDSVTVVHVVPPDGVQHTPVSVLPVIMGSGSAADARQTAEAQLRLMVDSHCPGASVDVVTGADFGAAIIDRCDALDADLVVLGTHERGGVMRALLGSVATHVVHHAHCPVAVIHQKVRSDR